MMEQEQPDAMQTVAVLQQVIEAQNVAELLDDVELARIGLDAVRDYKLDRDSMSDWFERMERGLKLATLVKDEKTYPFKGAANVKYPLITTAALQFNARAYPAIVASDQVVKVKTHGSDPMGLKAARGERVAAHMSWQLSSQIEEWEDDTDKLLVQLPIVGTMVRKVWYSPVDGRPRCRLIEAGKFIVNDKVKNLTDAPRATEELAFYPDEIVTRVRSGDFLDRMYAEDQGEDTHAPEDFIEQHCRLDLDDDGYEEPYVVTVHVKSMKVARIVADFEAGDIVASERGIISIRRGSYFAAYHFLPSMDGGFFGTGLGLLLGDISETINSIINMMMDAGHMASLGGGFIGSEFRIKGGSRRFSPGEWKLMADRGTDIKSAIVPMTFPGPDATLFQLLGLLIEAGKEVASVKDILTGDTGAKTMTATTTLALIEQGMMVFTAAYKRIFRSLKDEFRLLAKINAGTVRPEEYNEFHDHTDPQGQPVMLDPRQEYSALDMAIEPVADPRSVTKMQEAAKAQFLMQLADGGYISKEAAGERMMRAMEIGDVEELLPQPNPVQEQMMQMQMQMAQADLGMKLVEIDRALAEIEETRSKTVKNMADAAATQRSVEIDEMKARLEAIRDGIAALIGGRTQGMAGAPGGGNSSQPSGVYPFPAGDGGAGGVLGGQADPGGAAFGYPVGAGIA